MFTAKQYRDKAAEYNQLTATATTSDEKREYRDLEQRFTTLADNEEWMVGIAIRLCTRPISSPRFRLARDR